MAAPGAAIARSSPGPARLVGFALAVLGILVLVGLLPRFIGLLTTNPLSDVRAYYDAGARLNAGLPLYDLSIDVNASEFYRYPPLLAILFRPIAAFLPYEAAAALWGVGMVVAFGATVWLLGPRRFRTWAAVCALAFPIAWCLAIGQAQVLVTLLLTIASPAAVAVAGQLKVLPALAALYWLGRGEWRALGWFVAWSLGLLALQLVLEPQGTIDFFRITNLSQVGDIDNLSPFGLSPALWAVLASAGFVLTLVLARTRAGWATAVAYSVLVTPRLLAYLLMGLLACLSRPSTEVAEPHDGGSDTSSGTSG